MKRQGMRPKAKLALEDECIDLLESIDENLDDVHKLLALMVKMTEIGLVSRNRPDEEVREELAALTQASEQTDFYLGFLAGLDTGLRCRDKGPDDTPAAAE